MLQILARKSRENAIFSDKNLFFSCSMLEKMTNGAQKACAVC
jgi:hypothetical protein